MDTVTIVMSPSKLISNFNEAKLGVSRIAADGAKADPRRGAGAGSVRSPECRSSFHMFGNLQRPPGKLVDFFFYLHIQTFDLLKFAEDKAGVLVSEELLAS